MKRGAHGPSFEATVGMGRSCAPPCTVQDGRGAHMLNTTSIDLPSLVHGGTAPVYCEDGVTRTCHQAGNRLRHGYVYVNHRRVYGHIAFIPGESIWRFAAQGKHAWLAQPVPVLDTRVEG